MDRMKEKREWRRRPRYTFPRLQAPPSCPDRKKVDAQPDQVEKESGEGERGKRGEYGKSPESTVQVPYSGWRREVRGSDPEGKPKRRKLQGPCFFFFLVLLKKNKTM